MMPLFCQGKMLDAIRLAEVLVGHPQGGFIGQIIHHAVDGAAVAVVVFPAAAAHLRQQVQGSIRIRQKTFCLIQLLLQVLVTVHALAVSLVL